MKKKTKPEIEIKSGDEKRNSVKLGLLVLAGLILLTVTIYFVGAKKYMFTSTFELTAVFSDINGLQEGNIVRFRGLDVGTVGKMDVLNDSAIKVALQLENKIKPYLKKNAVAAIATDGLMGNKILVLQNGTAPAAAISGGETLTSLKPFDMDNALRKLGISNDNIVEITGNLKTTIGRMNNKNSLWSLFSDTVVGKEIKQVDTSFVKDLYKSIKNVREGSARFNQDMEALKHNFLLRRYFKKQEKKK